jgi:predicted ATPase/DNA-binding winged helix-turn-helix (wHTH) protein
LNALLMSGVVIRFGPHRLFPAERRLEREGRSVALGSRALDLLIALAERAGEVVPRRELMDRVWPDLTVEEANLRVHVAGLRKALGDGAEGGQYIANVSGHGYCFVATVEISQADPGPALVSALRKMPPLPPRPSRLVGRDRTVADVAALLRERRYVSVIGLGGMGKTTLAVAVAHELADSFEGQVAFVDLATLADPGSVTAYVSAAVGATLTEPDPLPGLLAFVANRRMLIVLDNCEHLADAVAPLAEQLYTRASKLHLLLTSREALRTEGEHVHTLAPLEGPPDHAVEASELLRYPAIQLFMERAAAGGYREPLDDAAAPLVASICHRLDGIALAIELVASRLGTHGFQGAAELLENRFRLLRQARRSALPRHQTLHAMLDWSFTLLSECDRAVLARLGVFAAPFDLAAVRAVAGGDGYDAFDVERSLDHLVEKSLVWTSASASAPLYRLPHVARDFALGELEKRNEKGKGNVSARHARHILSLLEPGRRHEPLDEKNPAPPLSPGLLPCLSVALNWAFSEEGERELATDLVAAATPLWLRIGQLGECRRWSARALDRLADHDKGSVKELALQEALATSAMYTRGNDHFVAAAIERGLALAVVLGETSRQMDLLARLHIFLMRAGAFDETVKISRRALEVAARLGSPRAQVMAEWMLGTSYHLVGRQKDAQCHCDRGSALAAASVLGDAFGDDHRMRIFCVMARCLWIQGRWDRGVALAGKAIQEAERGGSTLELCIALVYTAPVLLWNGSLNEAEAVIERLIIHADRHAPSPYRACDQALRGELLCARGRHEEAIECLRGALVHLNEENHLVMNSRALRALAESLMHAGHLEEAQSVVDGAIDRAERWGGKFDLSELLRTQGEIRLRAGDSAGAEAALLAAVAIAEEQAATSWRLRSGEALARLWMSRGRAEQAQTEVSSLLALLDDCGRGELLAATRHRLLTLRAELERPASAPPFQVFGGQTPQGSRVPGGA